MTTPLSEQEAAAKLAVELAEEEVRRATAAGDIVKLKEREKELQEEKLNLLKIEQAQGGTNLNTLKAQVDALKEAQEQYEKIAGIQKGSESIVSSIADKLGLVNSGFAKFISDFAGADNKAEAFNAALTGAGKAMDAIGGGAVIAVAALGKMVSTTIEVAKQADATRASFVAVTGDASGARDMFMGLTMSNLDLAISFDEMSKSQLALREQFAQFGFLSDSVRESVTLQAAQLEKLGVDAGVTAELMTTLTMTFGQSATEAAATQRSIVGLGQALKIPPGVISRDFAAALPTLARFGDDAIRIFEELSIAARDAGVSVQDLTSVFGDQFNTFEGAVGAAGRLNQALRTDVFSGMELLMANEAERHAIIKEGLQLSGVEFRNLETYEQLYIANALGISDVAQAARILGESQQDVAMRIGDTSFTVAEMEEMTKSATATMEKMQFVFMQLAVALKPVADGFAFIIQELLELNDVVPGGLGTLFGLVGAVGGGMALGPLGAIPGLMMAGAAFTGAGVTDVGDFSGPGGSMIMTPEGQTFRTSTADTVVAAKEGGPIVAAIDALRAEVASQRQQGSGMDLRSARIVLDIPELGRTLDARIKDITEDQVLGYV